MIQSSITPLSGEQQQRVIDETNNYIAQANKLFNIKAKNIDIQFNLKGRSAGMYRIKRNRKIFFSHCKREIRYNPYIFSKYFDDSFKTTIPHEVAHYISDIMHDLKNIKPHGNEWKAIMQAFGVDASVTASYDLSGIPLNNRTLFSYQCDCREHQLGIIRHNRIKNNQNQYFCKSCKQVLYIKPKDNETIYGSSP